MAKVLIIGGSRFIGPLLISEFVGRNWEVAVFNRGRTQSAYPQGVQFIKGDRRGGFSRIAGYFDAVVDTCAYVGEDTKRAASELDFGFFVHMSTAAVYRKTEIFPLTENFELGEWPLWGDYNRGKIECEKVLTDSSVPFAAIRPVYILGPRNYADRERFIYSCLVSGREIVLPGDGEALAQFVFVEEVARAIVFLAENKITGAFNCSGDDIITLNGLVREMAGIAGKKALVKYNPAASGSRHRPEEFPFANEHLFCSNEKIKVQGIKFTPLVEGLWRDYEAYYRHV